VTSERDLDKPQPPGGPLRQDAPAGGLAPDGERAELPDGGSDGDQPVEGSVPPVSHDEPEQGDVAAAVQEENAESSQDQPSQ
jgi:hypothetical protein